MARQCATDLGSEGRMILPLNEAAPPHVKGGTGMIQPRPFALSRAAARQANDLHLIFAAQHLRTFAVTAPISKTALSELIGLICGVRSIPAQGR